MYISTILRSTIRCLVAAQCLLAAFTMASNHTNSTVYFGYGSNLWKEQMISRCPTSAYLGIARLNGFRWIINDRGYANVVEVKNETTLYKDVVWGLVYRLEPADEENLDINEGVPEAYTKENLTVDYWRVGDQDHPNIKDDPEATEMLVYIDRERLKPDEPKKEYIYRMNMGINDAVKEGMPHDYVEDVLRSFIPDLQDEKVAEFARQQALFFEDER